MENRVFITGSSLICSLGDKKEEIVKNLKALDSLDYEKNIMQHLENGTLYGIKNFSKNPTKRFYEVIEKSVEDSIKEANLDKIKQQDLAIFIGSTSMKISTDEERLTHLGYEIIGQKIEEQTGARGGFYIFSTACTSSINAFNYAAEMIKDGQIKRALVVGFEFFNKTTREGFENFMLLSPKNIYRPFDENSDGIVLGEGCSSIVLEAKKEGGFEYLGSSNICDTYSETTSDENGKSIGKCLEMALKDAQLPILELSLIKAHTAGSQNSNTAEINGLNLFLKDKDIPITSVKSFIGHTLGGSGVNEIVLLLLCLENGFIPCVAGFCKNEGLKLNLVKKQQKINKKVNVLFSFTGFGGNNTCTILGNR